MGCNRHLVGRDFINVGSNHIPKGAYVRAIEEKVFDSFNGAAFSAVRGRMNSHAM